MVGKNQNNDSSVFDSICKPETSAQTARIWFATFIFVGFLIAFSNLATILTFVVNRRLRRRSVFCLINLAVADMMYGGSLIAYCCYEISQSQLMAFIFQMRLELIGARTFVLTTPGLCLVLVALERYYVTFFPIRHRSTRRITYVKIFVVLWVLAAIFAVSHHLAPDPFYSHLSIFYLFLAVLSLIIIISSYTAIFVKVKLQNRERLRLQQQTSIQSVTQRSERHLAVTMFLVTLLSLLTWLPYLAIQLYSHVSLSCDYLNALLFTMLVQFCNSLINPIVYVLRMQDFRRGLTAVVFRCSRYQQPVYPVGLINVHRLPQNVL